MSNKVISAAIQADNFLTALRDSRHGPVVGAREREVIHGVTDRGVFVGGMTADAFLATAGNILTDSGRVFTYGNSIVYETARDEGGSLTSLAVNGIVDPRASSIVANLFVTAHEIGTSTVQSLPAPKLVSALLADESLARRLPTVNNYSRRPTFDRDFVLCNRGWNPGPGILVHGPEIAPSPFACAEAPSDKAIDRLPPHLRVLLREFQWRSEADLVNTVGTLVTGLLINHFIDEPHPAVIVDGNQPQLGKTLLVQTIGWVLDAKEPPRIPMTRDEEMEKRLCAQVRCSETSLFFFDNVRSKIESAVLEQNIPSPIVSFRILVLQRQVVPS